MNETWNRTVGVDSFNRSFAPITGTKQDKYVGMMYFFWVGQHKMDDVYDMTKLMDTEEGRASLFNPEGTPQSPMGNFHYWGEPLFGYYNMLDEWIMRRHIEMLTTAGIDFLMIDATNGVTYDPVWKIFMKLLDEYQQQGWNVPRIAFYTHARSIQVTQRIYANLYAQNYYPNTWFYIDGKPLIVAYTDPLEDRAALAKEVLGPLPEDYKNSPSFTQEELDFFHFRKPQWPNEPLVDEKGFPWMSWTFPQANQDGIVNVSLAQHPELPMNFSYTRGYTNWGRGWDGVTNDPDRGRTGENFKRQFEAALSTDPEIMYFTGWNEWIALKFNYLGEPAFVDCFMEEYSRDIEPMKGGYEDAFYLQLISYIREFKGSGDSVSPVPAIEADLMKEEAWASVQTKYSKMGEATYGRDYKNGPGTAQYTMAAPRNNIQEIKVAHDAGNVYFHIRTEQAITAYEGGSNWMNLFIGTGKPEVKGWQGYEYVINSTPGKIEALQADFTKSEAGDIASALHGNVMMVSVPLSSLQLTGSFELYFKVADGVVDDGDIMDYYVTGISLPMGRLSFSYQGN